MVDSLFSSYLGPIASDPLTAMRDVFCEAGKGKWALTGFIWEENLGSKKSARECREKGEIHLPEGLGDDRTLRTGTHTGKDMSLVGGGVQLGRS